MPIRKRTAVSNPTVFNEDTALRIALAAGVQKLTRQRDDLAGFDDVSDHDAMKLDRQIAYLERMLKDDGLLTLVSR